MSTKSTRASQGAILARRAAIAIGRELRDARISSGLAQRAVGSAAGLSQSQVSRLELGSIGRPRIDHLERVAVALGLVLSLRLYPAGNPVRDAGQLALLGRLAARIIGALRLRREVPLPGLGEQRAWDARLEGRGPPCAVEAEVHLHDMQELARRVALKLRDDPTVDRVILLVARSAHNRAVLRENRETLREQFPLEGSAILACLRRGEPPPASGILVL
ncbi:MAG: helix-turn-helix domain-containing protein [Candidatus Limnocylindrales bacterium]